MAVTESHCWDLRDGTDTERQDRVPTGGVRYGMLAALGYALGTSLVFDRPCPNKYSCVICIWMGTTGRNGQYESPRHAKNIYPVRPDTRKVIVWRSGPSALVAHCAFAHVCMLCMQP